jgi:hypothetical protein
MIFFDTLIVAAIVTAILILTHGFGCFCLLTLTLIGLVRYYCLGIEMGESPIYEAPPSKQETPLQPIK